MGKNKISSKALVKSGKTKESKKFNKKVQKLTKEGNKFKDSLPEIKDDIQGRRLFEANEKALLGFCTIIANIVAEYEETNKKNPMHTDVTAMRGLMECYSDLMNKVEMMHNSKFIVGHIIDNMVQQELINMAKNIGGNLNKTINEILQEMPNTMFVQGGRNQFIKVLEEKKSELLSNMGRVFDNGIYELKNNINMEVHKRENDIKKSKRKI